jgi:hypothetical protein
VRAFFAFNDNRRKSFLSAALSIQVEIIVNIYIERLKRKKKTSSASHKANCAVREKNREKIVYESPTNLENKFNELRARRTKKKKGKNAFYVFRYSQFSLLVFINILSLPAFYELREKCMKFHARSAE